MIHENLDACHPHHDDLIFCNIVEQEANLLSGWNFAFSIKIAYPDF
jgi:hypothetical protein